MNATLTPTRHNLLTDVVKDRSKQMAEYFLANFKWSLPQMRILMQLADKGYMVSHMNPVLTTFGKSTVTNDRMQIIICDYNFARNTKTGAVGGKINKRSISFIAL